MHGDHRRKLWRNQKVVEILQSRDGCLRLPKRGPPLYLKKLHDLKMIFRPFGAKKKLIWKMTLAAPPPPNMEFFFEGAPLKLKQ